jgi:hypothetical protein
MGKIPARKFIENNKNSRRQRRQSQRENKRKTQPKRRRKKFEMEKVVADLQLRKWKTFSLSPSAARAFAFPRFDCTLLCVLGRRETKKKVFFKQFVVELFFPEHFHFDSCLAPSLSLSLSRSRELQFSGSNDVALRRENFMHNDYEMIC